MRKQYKTYRWAVWAIVAFVYMVSFFHRMAVGAIQEDLSTEFSLNSTAIAAFGSIFFYIYTAMQIPAGILADTLGPRRTLLIGSMVSSLGSLLFGFAPTVAVAYAARFLVGLGVSVIFVSMMSVNGRWFSAKYFATISGTSTFIGNLGGVFAQTPLVLLAAAFSWRSAFLGIGVVGILSGVLCYIILRDKPEDLGFPVVCPEAAKSPNRHFGHAIGAFFKNPHSWPPCLLFFGTYSCQATFTGTFGLQYFRECFGFTDVQGGNLTLISMLAMAISTPIYGLISDRIGRRKPVLAVVGTLTLSVWLIMLFFSRYLSYGAFVVLMIAAGCSWGCIPLCLTVAREVNDPAYSGVNTACGNMYAYLGASIVPMVFGAVLDHLRPALAGHDLYRWAFLVLLACGVLTAVMLPLLKETRCTNIHGQ